MRCGECGANAGASPRFCGNCGARLSGRGPDPTPESRPATRPLRQREPHRAAEFVGATPPGTGRRTLVVALVIVLAGVAVAIASTPQLSARITGADGPGDVDVGRAEQTGDLEGIDPSVGPARVLPPEGVVFPRELWAVQQVSNTTPLVAADDVYAVSLDGALLAVDPRTGDVRWRGDPQQVRPGAVLLDAPPYVVAADLDGRLAAFDRGAGALVWSVDLPVLAAPTTTPGRVHAVVSDRELGAAPAAALVTLDLETGDELQRTAIGPSGPIHPPVVVGDLLVICTADGNVQGRARRDHALRWEHVVAGTPSCAGSESEQAVAVGSLFGDVAVIEVDGDVRWEQVLEGAIAGPPTIAGRGVYLTSGFELFGFDAATGEILWRSDAPGRTHRNPVANRRTVFVATANGHIYANYLHTGAVRWVWDAGAPVSSEVALAQDMAIVALPDGRLVAIGVWLPAGTPQLAPQVVPPFSVS